MTIFFLFVILFDDDTHYLSKIVEQKENGMKRKKIFKKLLVVALAVALLNIGVTAEKAGAATCPPHGDYYDRVVYGRSTGYQHSAKANYYVEDEYGNKVNLSDVTGKTYYVTCTVTFDELFVDVLCEKCSLKMSSYSYTTTEMHSYCPAG